MSAPTSAAPPTTTRSARPTRSWCRAWGRSGGDAPSAGGRARRGDRERAESFTPVLGICLGMQLLFEASAEHDARRARPAARRGDAAGSAELPHIGWNRVALERESELRKASATLSPSTTRIRSSAGRRATTTWSAAASTASASPRSWSASTSPASISIPRSPRATGSRCCTTSSSDPLSRHRHPRRQGRPPRQGPLRGPDRLPRRSADGGPVVGRGGRALPPRRRPRRRRSGEPRSIEHLRRIVSETGVPVQYGGGLRSLPAVREALRAGAERVIIGRRRSATSTSSTR